MRQKILRYVLLLVGVTIAYVWWGSMPMREVPQGKIDYATPSYRLDNGDYFFPVDFQANPYPHIPAQCFIETAAGTQNACLFCHTNGVWAQQAGNNNPQAGAFPEAIGNFQLEYAFGPYNTASPLATVNHWDNTLYPEKLAAHVASLGIDTNQWDMSTYIRQNNWQKAYDQRPDKSPNWDSRVDSPFRLLPALNPADLPAHTDGYVRSASAQSAYFFDGKGFNTGWRAINFMPYGIFTPQTGSVSGVYIRLPVIFMQNAQGEFDLPTYSQNLDLLAKAIQNRLTVGDAKYYLGRAHTVQVETGVYPVGTEFAHPLHYVDMDADGHDARVSSFPGTRSQRVKEVRYMIKWEPINVNLIDPLLASDAWQIMGNERQGWIDNGAGWYLVGFIEDKVGDLRPQTREELTQCIGCHSAPRPHREAILTSGTGNTIDSTWSLARQLPNDQGWGEMNYLGYLKGQVVTSMSEPMNRDQKVGEYRFFLDHVVGANLYGEMPLSIEGFLQQHIRIEKGYSVDWPVIDMASADRYAQSQKLRQRLVREMTAKGGHKDGKGHVFADLLYPPKSEALANATRYRQVVVTQSFNKGKDVFPSTPHTYRAMRVGDDAVRKIDDSSYNFGEIITERSIDKDDTKALTYRVGNQATEIDPALPFAQGGNYVPTYTPFLLAMPPTE